MLISNVFYELFSTCKYVGFANKILALGYKYNSIFFVNRVTN